MKELSEQVDSHVVVLDEEILGGTIPTDAQSAQPTNLSSTISDAAIAPKTMTADP